MSVKTCDVAVIGGGPAGMAAAERAARDGASTILVDGSPALGGHFYKHTADAMMAPRSRSEQREADELVRRVDALRDLGVEMLNNARVWGVFDGRETTLGTPPGQSAAVAPERFTLWLDHTAAAPSGIETRTLILSPGVYDRPLPFPGWTLPGVMTPGGVQMLIKKQGIAPGSRAVVAGTGPLQPAVAATLAGAGVTVVALLDVCGVGDGLGRAVGGMWRQWARMSEGASYAGACVRQSVPLRFRHAVFRALGSADGGVEAAVIGRVDREGHPLPGTEQTVECDLICVAYGFIPDIALTLHLGCTHDYDLRLGAHLPRHDERMATSIPRVYVAGDVTGVGGKPLADLQGRIAAMSALEDLGIRSPHEAARERRLLAGAVRREGRFARLLWDRFRLREGLLDLVTDDTPICRCENVLAREVLDSCANGAADLYGTKLRTRVGMGVCQGRYCSDSARLLLARSRGRPPAELGPRSVRPPLVPVRLGEIAAQALSGTDAHE